WSQNCLMHGELQPRITHQQGQTTALSSGDVQESRLWRGSQWLHSSARAGPAGAAVPLCQVILVALVLRVEIIWLCFLFHDSQSQNCLLHGEVQHRITHQQGQTTALLSSGPQDSSLWQSDQWLYSSARAGLAGAAVPLCQVILVALVLRVEIIWLCFLFHDSQSQNCLLHGEV